MKNILNRFLLVSIGLFLFISCIKEESPYREAEVLKFSLLEEDADNLLNVLYDHSQRLITVIVEDTAGYQNKIIKAEIEVAPEATVFPVSGSLLQLKDYETSLIVTPESKEKSVKYTVQFKAAYKFLRFDFEDWDTKKFLSKPYCQPQDPIWSTANEGIKLIYVDETPFPTRPSGKGWPVNTIYPDEENIIAPSGERVAILETCLGKMAGVIQVPIAPGSLYMGVFKFTLNWNEPALSAQFGQPHSYSTGRPVKLQGYYKYKSGEKFQTFKPDDSGKKVVEYVDGKKDECDIYAILFKVKKGSEGLKEFLTAYDLQTSDKIVGKAIMEDGSETDGNDWHHFEIPFTYSEEINYDENDYKLAIVFSSSRGGAYFEGAIGSKLMIDKIEIACEPFEQ